jgi:hypothetical protein
MLAYLEIIPLSVRALLCYMMPGDPPNEYAIDFPTLFNTIFNPWIIEQVKSQLARDCKDTDLRDSVQLVMTFSLNRYKYTND